MLLGSHEGGEPALASLQESKIYLYSQSQWSQGIFMALPRHMII